ncbi:MAG: hypothetical protein JRN20_20765 [Nitrososphaerota archaeon]|nr:hypothetical protein [Nitrososphaerota archaeon]
MSKARKNKAISLGVSAVIAIILVLIVGFGLFLNDSFNTASTSSSSISLCQGLPCSITTSLTTNSFSSGSGSGQLGSWMNTTSYPASRPPSSCVTTGNFIYCVGGNGNLTYFAPLVSTGVGQWWQTMDYPIPIQDENCVESSGFIYCVGGVSNGANGKSANSDPYGRTSDVFYAPLSASGIGTWVNTTQFPYVAASPRCMTYDSRIYCIEAALNGTGYTSSAKAFFAPLTSSGVGSWAKTSSPPSMTAGCTAVGSDAYCFGGGQCPPIPEGDCYSPSFVAALSPDGIGSWNETSELPTAGYAIYASSGSYVYYLSTPVFYSQVLPTGISSWETTTNLPDSANPGACASTAKYIYCVGGGTDDVFYAQVGASNPQAFVLQNPPPFPGAEYLVPAWTGSGGCSVSVNGTFAGAPCFSTNIDDSVIFNCAASAATSSGCTTTVISPANSAYDYNITIWYPSVNATSPDANCAFQPTLGYKTPSFAWCISIGKNSFIIAQEIQMQPSQT